MFHTILTLAYIIPNIYLFVRIWQLFIARKYRLVFTIGYLLFALIYPVSNFLNEESGGTLAVLLNTISGYLLPFYLNLFLLVLFFDILLLLNLLLKVVPPATVRKPSFRTYAFSGIITGAVIILVAGIINFNTIRISEYNISVPARSSGISGLRIAFVSDFHLQNRTSKRFVKNFMSKISGINPDLMIFGGDIVEGDRDDGNLSIFENYFSGIKTKYGVFGVLGNHEHYAGQDKGNFFDRSGIQVLCDSIVRIDNSFCLCGRNDNHFTGRKEIGTIMKGTDNDLPFILVDHRPTDLDAVSKERIDVQLSGHTHNGQLFPINLITRSVYRLSWGHEKIGHTDFFVSSGIRLWGPPVRTAGKSEIMVINLSFK